MKLIRVIYGKKETAKTDREYRKNGVGSVGTLAEWEEQFPEAEFVIEDSINGDEE